MVWLKLSCGVCDPAGVCWHHFLFCLSRNFCLLSTGISSRLMPWLLALRQAGEADRRERQVRWEGESDRGYGKGGKQGKTMGETDVLTLR